MPTKKKTDLQVLRALMAMPAGKLSANEKTVFRRMYEDVAGGMVISLSKKQRMWADSVYAKHDLDNPKNRQEAAPAPVKAAPKKPLTQADVLRRRAAELGFPSPVPDEKLPQLIEAITPETMKVIVAKAAERGMTVEKLSVGYIRKLLG